MKPHLHRHLGNPAALAAALGRAGCAFGAADGVEAFNKHQSANNTEKDHIAKPHQEIDLPQSLEIIKDHNPDRRAHKPANKQDRAHLQINGFAFEVRKHPRKGGGDNLVGFCGHSHRGGNADKEQKRRHQKAATNPEHPRQNAHNPAQPQKDKGVDRNLGDGQVYHHTLS